MGLGHLTAIGVKSGEFGGEVGVVEEVAGSGHEGVELLAFWEGLGVGERL